MEQGAGDLGTNRRLPILSSPLSGKDRQPAFSTVDETRLGHSGVASTGLTPGQAGLLEEGASHLALQDKELAR